MWQLSYTSVAMIDWPCRSSGIPSLVSLSCDIEMLSENVLKLFADMILSQEGCHSWRWRCMLYFQCTSTHSWHWMGILVDGFLSDVFEAALILKLYACEHVEIAFPHGVHRVQCHHQVHRLWLQGQGQGHYSSVDDMFLLMPSASSQATSWYSSSEFLHPWRYGADQGCHVCQWAGGAHTNCLDGCRGA